MILSNFIDFVKITASSGKGGDGVIHFRREKFVSKGGPDGGNGGRGGHVILIGDKNISTLFYLKYFNFFFAGDGCSGSDSNKTGLNGKDLFINVPIGTIIKNFNTGKILINVLRNKEKYILLSGGKGGYGNFNFKSSINQNPKFFQSGQFGIKKIFLLELKLLSHVGFIGYPNSGKSTLLSIISSAKPVIANYPFTTILPNFGVVYLSNIYSFLVLDVPGILKNASIGKGLGIRFLKHLERNKILIFIIDSYEFSIYKTYLVLLNEIFNYKNNLIFKKILIVISKCDLIDKDVKKEISKDLSFLDYIFISSFTREGILLLKLKIWNLLK